MAFATPSFGAIALNSPTTDWNPIVYPGATRSDYLKDQQTGDGESDLVGSAPGQPMQTAFYFRLEGDEIAFRVRVNTDSNSVGYAGAIWVGLMLDDDDSVDLFAGLYSSSSGKETYGGYYNPGSGANTSPSTTTVETSRPISTQTLSSSTFLFTPVTIGPSGNDPVPGGITDVGEDGKNDYFATWVLSFSQLVSAAATLDFTVTKDTPFRFVVGTSQQAQSMNQDLNGAEKITKANETMTFAALGAVSPFITAEGGIVPDPTPDPTPDPFPDPTPDPTPISVPEPGTVSTLLVGIGLLAGAALLRRRKAGAGLKG